MEYTILCPCCGQPINLSIADGVVVINRGAICNKSVPEATGVAPATIEFGEGGETNIERAHHTK